MRNPVERAAIGIRAHSGWAVLVAVGGSFASPAVLKREHIVLVNKRVPGSAQPYHAAKVMRIEEAEAFLKSCAGTAAAMARNAVQAIVSELAGTGYEVSGSCILWGSGRTTTDLTAILASHPLIHTAEGEFFREALRSACQCCGLAVLAVKEREVLARSAAALNISPDEAMRQASALGKSIGPPWTHDEKLCVLASWLVKG